MRIFALAAMMCAGFSAASNFLDTPQTLAWDNLPASVIPYNETLSCGGCIRGGYTYCAEKGSKVGRGLNDKCCDSEECALKALEDGKDCGHSNSTFAFSKYYYPDPYVLLQKFCSRRQDSLTCCGNQGNNECKIKTKFQEPQDQIIDINKLTWGGSCTYKVEAKCGLPTIQVNSSEIDLVVAFKKN